MADPLSIAGSAVGVISLGIQVTHSLYDFYNSYRDQDAEVASFLENVEVLKVVLHCLQTSLTKRRFLQTEEGLVERIEQSIQSCSEAIQELQEECGKFHKAPTKGLKDGFKVIGRRVAYPFRQSTIQKLNEDIGDIRSNISLSMEVLQVSDAQVSHETNFEIKSLLELVRGGQISSIMREWLHAPDATIDHNAACAKKHPGTGNWLTNSEQFSSWLTGENSSLWLKGFAGSGKSVLCSTAIQSIFRHRRGDRRTGIAFFYFTFSDELKRDESALLRALLWQLSSQLSDSHKDLTQLYESYSSGVPPSTALLSCLQRLIQKFHHTYIVLDALDECPRTGSRDSVLDTLEAMNGWGMNNLHILVTSRDEQDVHECLDMIGYHHIEMRNSGIDEDISKFISGQLDNNRKLRNLSFYHHRIRDTLIKGAKGMFRWVECQLKSLQSCARSEHHVEKMLKSLPQTLDETYERMFCNVEEYLVEDTKRILTMLCFSYRPLTVEELIDAIAVDETGFNRARKLQDVDAVRDLCSNFITVNVNPMSRKLDVPQSSYSPAAEEEDYAVKFEMTVQIAHFSVQEYLESERIQNGKAAIFSLNRATASAEIAQICLTYMLDDEFSQSKLLNEPARSNRPVVVDGYPFSSFAAEFWSQFYKDAGPLASKLNSSILKLFQNPRLLILWAKLYDPLDGPSDFRPFLGVGYQPDLTLYPIYCASYLGLEATLQVLINDVPPAIISQSVTYELDDIVDALKASCNHGYSPVVQILLDHGVDVNTHGVLQAASRWGHQETVKLLLDHGADVNQEGGSYATALQAASQGGHQEVVKLLLDHGAIVNREGGTYGSALQAAAEDGHQETVKLLLDYGADVNIEGGYHRTALIAASQGAHQETVKLLLDYGADVNQEGGSYATALRAASQRGHQEIVTLLLDHGAVVNKKGESYGTALQAASHEGYQEISKLLLDRGADVNIEGGLYGTALQAASQGGHQETVRLLLDHGADVNKEGGWYGTALLAASRRGHQGIVKLLLDYGADVNLKGGLFRTALLAASRGGDWGMAKLLLDPGADVNIGNGERRTALQMASQRDHRDIVKLLLDHGAQWPYAVRGGDDEEEEDDAER